MTDAGPPRATWYVDLLVAAVAWAAALGIALLHVVDVRRDLAQERLRARDVERFRHHHDLQGLARLVQHLGTVQFTVTVAVLVAVGLLLTGRRSRALAVIGVTYAVVYLVGVGKLLIRHPPVAEAFGHHIGSFPSGHTADVTAIAGVILVCLTPLRWRLLPYAVAVGGGIVVGSTRVISGAHTPDDVVAGWLLGSALVLTAGTWLARREGQSATPSRASTRSRTSAGAPGS